MNHNKICNLADFADEELAEVIRDVCGYKLDLLPSLPAGVEHRKDWEVAMAVRALRSFGALRPDAVILGVAAGTEDTLFYLTRHVRQVFATDRYVSAGSWAPVAPVAMLVDPALLAPFDFDRSRLVVQHMDARWLRYPDDTFDGIFSSGSIEHVGEMIDVAHAAYEMGRVLKPGGVLSLSTELRHQGPEGGIGWPGSTLVFDRATLARYIVEATGLEMVDELQAEMTAETLGTRVSLNWAIADHRDRVADPYGPGPDGEYACWQFPHIALDHGDYTFTSVHLTLVKTDRYPLVPNGWARPSPATVESIEAYDRSVFITGDADGSAPVGSEQHQPARPVLEPTVAELVGEAEVIRCLQEVDDRARETARTLALLSERQAQIGALAGKHGSPDLPMVVPRSRWLSSYVTVADGVGFSVVVDPDVGDPITLTLLQGSVLDPTLVRLMLDMVGPNDHVLDLGAHLGSFSLAACAAGCQVLAVEASPLNSALLRTSAFRNGFVGLRVVQAAVGDAPGEVAFSPNGPWGQVATDMDSAGPADTSAATATVTVPAVTIDSVLAEYGFGPVKFVKIDVEGSEVRAFKGMSSLLSGPAAPAVLYESNAHTLAGHGTSPNALMAELESFGYSSYAVEPGRLVRVRANEMQTLTITDHLAVKRPPAVAGWTVEPSFTPEERVARLAADGRHDNPHHRANTAATLAGAGSGILGHPMIASLLVSLADDPVDEVRAALDWWVPNR